MSLAESIQMNFIDEVARIFAEEIQAKVDRHGQARYCETRIIVLD